MKTVVITGASGLIGSEMVREFLARGHEVFGLDLKPNKELAHPHYHYRKCDIADEASVKKALSGIKAIHVLVNNGAKADPQNRKFHQLSLKEWDKILSINLTSVFLLTKYCLPLLKKSRGSVINISSTRHRMSEPDTELYTVAKGGLDALTRALAVSYGPEVRVNSISPGWINDPKELLSPEDHEQHPAGRVGVPSDIARMCVYLAEDEQGFITGTDIVIDGGMTAKMIYR